MKCVVSAGPGLRLPSPLGSEHQQGAASVCTALSALLLSVPSPASWAPTGPLLHSPCMPCSLLLAWCSLRRWKNSRALKRSLVQNYKLVTSGLNLPGARFHLGGVANTPLSPYLKTSGFAIQRSTCLVFFLKQ